MFEFEEEDHDYIIEEKLRNLLTIIVLEGAYGATIWAGVNFCWPNKATLTRIFLALLIGWAFPFIFGVVDAGIIRGIREKAFRGFLQGVKELFLWCFFWPISLPLMAWQRRIW